MKKFWDEIIKNAGKTSLSELRDTDTKTLYYAWLKACRDEGIKSTLSYTLPCEDGKLLTKDTFNIKTISAMPKILGVTTADMIPIVLKLFVKKWVRNDKGSKCFVYLFARNLPGDNCGAWHSSDLPYVFATLKNGWRPFTDIDYLISEQMVAAISAFVKCGDPNCREIPTWKPGTHKVMNFCEKTRLAGWKTATLIKNTLFNKGPVL